MVATYVPHEIRVVSMTHFANSWALNGASQIKFRQELVRITQLLGSVPFQATKKSPYVAGPCRKNQIRIRWQLRYIKTIASIFNCMRLKRLLCSVSDEKKGRANTSFI